MLFLDEGLKIKVDKMNNGNNKEEIIEPTHESFTKTERKIYIFKEVVY